MTHPTLLAVRLPPRMLADLHRCPGILDRFRILAIGQHDEAEVRLHAGGMAINYLRDWPDETSEERTLDLYAAIARSCNVTHAIIAQPGHWYSSAVDGGFAVAGVSARRFWLESYFDRATLDEIGGPYDRANEVTAYADVLRCERALLGPVSKFAQPVAISREEVRSRLGADPARTLVIYGQCPGDMALAQSAGNLDYYGWIAAISDCNPGIRILFKQHPLARTVLAPVWPNVSELPDDFDTLSLLDAFPYGAAYSSTVILEGVARGVQFATGGFHYLHPYCYTVTDAHSAGPLLPKLDEFYQAPSSDRARRTRSIDCRLGFLERAYALHLSDPATLVRLTVDPMRLADYYAWRAAR